MRPWSGRRPPRSMGHGPLIRPDDISKGSIDSHEHQHLRFSRITFQQHESGRDKPDAHFLVPGTRVGHSPDLEHPKSLTAPHTKTWSRRGRTSSAGRASITRERQGGVRWQPSGLGSSYEIGRQIRRSRHAEELEGANVVVGEQLQEVVHG